MQQENMEHILRIRVPRNVYLDCLHLAENHSIPLSTYARVLLKKALYGKDAKEDFEKLARQNKNRKRERK